MCTMHSCPIATMPHAAPTPPYYHASNLRAFIPPCHCQARPPCIHTSIPPYLHTSIPPYLLPPCHHAVVPTSHHPPSVSRIHASSTCTPVHPPLAPKGMHLQRAWDRHKERESQRYAHARKHAQGHPAHAPTGMHGIPWASLGGAD